MLLSAKELAVRSESAALKCKRVELSIDVLMVLRYCILIFHHLRMFCPTCARKVVYLKLNTCALYSS